MDGDERRKRVLQMTGKLKTGALGLGFEVENDGDFPIVGIVISDIDIMVAACQTLWEHDILITPATYPAVPIDRNLMRFSITAANTDEEVEMALAGLEAVRAQLGEVVLRGASKVTQPVQQKVNQAV